jgi:hypothetical protein
MVQLHKAWRIEASVNVGDPQHPTNIMAHNHKSIPRSAQEFITVYVRRVLLADFIYIPNQQSTSFLFTLDIRGTSGAAFPFGTHHYSN